MNGYAKDKVLCTVHISSFMQFFVMVLIRSDFPSRALLLTSFHPFAHLDSSKTKTCPVKSKIVPFLPSFLLSFCRNYFASM